MFAYEEILILLRNELQNKCQQGAQLNQTIAAERNKAEVEKIYLQNKLKKALEEAASLRIVAKYIYIYIYFVLQQFSTFLLINRM